MKKRPHYKFLDGMRGIAAMTVVLLHTFQMAGLAGDAERDLPAAWQAISIVGKFGVPMFIVLSGFVLMLPIALSGNMKVRGGTWTYIKARARRILPPYYVSLLLFMGLIWLVPAMGTRMGTAWDGSIPMTADGVVTHLLVIQNLNPDWVYQINGPAWSVATEWQLYFALPLLLLPLWRKFGRITMLTVAVVLGLAITFIFPSTGSGHLWFLSLFALGMMAADICVNNRSIPALGLLTGAAWIAVIAALWADGPLSAIAGSGAYVAFSETLIGLAIALLVVLLVQRGSGVAVRIRKLFESRFLVWMGFWSYSLYLIHHPLLGLGNILMLDVEMSTAARFAIQLLITMPLSMGVAYAFHVLVERRFLTSHQRKVAEELDRKSASLPDPV